MTGPSATREPAIFLSEPEYLQEGLVFGGVGVWRWRIDSDELSWTANLERVHGLPDGSFDGTLSSFQRDLHPDDAQAVWNSIKESVKTGRPYRAVYRAAPRAGERDLWIETCGGVATTPDGTRFLTGICHDVSERVRNENELERRLAQQRAIAEFGSLALSEGSFQRVLDEAVAIAARVLHVPLAKILQFSDTAEQLRLEAGVGWQQGLVGKATVGIDQESQAGFTLMAGKPVIVTDLLTETRFSGPALLHDHAVRSGVSVVIPGADNRPFGVFGVHAREPRIFDDTDAEFLLSLANIVASASRQAAAREHKVLLVREMAHRAGNMLQLVTSIANQTFRGADDVDVAAQSFSERLNSLARANLVVARGGWTTTRFTDLLREALRPFGDRIEMRGREILLPPELCFDMGLVLHELATNSVKYGTLGDRTNSVRVSWSLAATSSEAALFVFSWEDPTSSRGSGTKGTGFGSKLIGALVERKWNGVVKVPDGANFGITFEIPVATDAIGNEQSQYSPTA